MMTFTGAIERENTITVDGYSNMKTERGAITDMGLYLKKVYGSDESLKARNKEEAKGLLECRPETSGGGFFVTCEEVCCASQYNEDIDEMEYKEGYNFYVCVRFVK